MQGLMMDYPLTLQHAFNRAVRIFPRKEIVTQTDNGLHRYTYRDWGKRALQLANALHNAGVQEGDLGRHPERGLGRHPGRGVGAAGRGRPDPDHAEPWRACGHADLRPAGGSGRAGVLGGPGPAQGAGPGRLRGGHPEGRRHPAPDADRRLRGRRQPQPGGVPVALTVPLT